MKFTPSPWLFIRTVVGGLTAVILVAYLWQGYGEGRWWSFDDALTLTIPIILIPCLAWLPFVPMTFEVSDQSLHIRFALRQDEQLDWNDLKYWGNGGHATFMLQFAGRGTIQIALFAFPRQQRRYLIDFLEKRYSQRKARGWFGIRGFR